MASWKQEDIKYLANALKNHKGKWLDEEVVKKYRLMDNQLFSTIREMTGERRKLCQQMMEEYDITEIEATNILIGYWANDHITKYERIRTQTPLKINNEEKKKDDIEEE